MKLADRRLSQRCVVLTYHRVLPGERQRQSFSTPSIIVTPECFERHMRFLARHFKILDLNQFIACQAGNSPWPKRACLVTFDDGWVDNIEFAHPVLKKYGVQAVLFAAGGYIGTGATFWQEDLAHRLFAYWEQRRLPVSVAERLSSKSNAYALSRGAAKRAILDLIGAIKARRESELPSLLSELEGEIGDPAASQDHFMDWSQLRQLVAEGTFIIGSHAMSHLPVTELPAERLAEELADSRDLLARECGEVPAAFAYPNGNFNDSAASLVRQTGYRVAFTTQPGLVEAGTDPMRIKRVNISNLSAPDELRLLGKIAGIA